MATRGLEGEPAVSCFELRKRYHIDRVPRTSFQECPIRPLACAKLASDAEQGIDDDPPKRGVVEVW
jgi:hypothetical protein